MGFLFTMLANFLPSLRLMGDRELLVNMIALGILLITILVNLCIQMVINWFLDGIDLIFLLSTVFLVFSVALIVPESRRIFELQYKELHGQDSNHKEIHFSYKELLHNVKKYWVMAETSNPQFVIACSQVSLALGVVCLYLAFTSAIILLTEYRYFLTHLGDSDYKWSIKAIVILQLVELRNNGSEGFNIGNGIMSVHISQAAIAKLFSIRTCIRKPNASNNNIISEVKEYRRYVLLFEEDAVLSKRVLKNILRSITKLLEDSEKKDPRNLMKLLEKSTNFNGVVEFDNDQVPHLHGDDVHNCWSLVLVTLTDVAIALPNVAYTRVKELLAGMREGLKIVKRDVAVQNVIQFKSRKSKSLNRSLHKFIVSSYMYRISETVLLHCNKQESWPNDEGLFDWISSVIADVLCACFTNIPCVVTMMCHHDAIEKREHSIHAVAKLLGKSKNILSVLEKRQLPNMDVDSMAYIDNWHALPNSELPNGCASSNHVQPASASTNGSLIVTVM
ncbi:uncharacterized protein [Rutidosis leptorrhynchoides]|uniref:uncharacterized protein n=1 Tax=Rutidosis leptorrhynchoides TaxID=125765 RepID=UPI003A9A64CF